MRNRSYSGLRFPAFGLNKERYGVSLRIDSEYGKIRTRITPNTDTFYGVLSFNFEIAGAKLMCRTIFDNYYTVAELQLKLKWDNWQVYYRFSLKTKVNIPAQVFNVFKVVWFNNHLLLQQILLSNLKHANILLLFLWRVIVIDKTCKCMIFLS